MLILSWAYLGLMPFPYPFPFRLPLPFLWLSAQGRIHLLLSCAQLAEEFSDWLRDIKCADALPLLAAQAVTDFDHLTELFGNDGQTDPADIALALPGSPLHV